LARLDLLPAPQQKVDLLIATSSLIVVSTPRTAPRQRFRISAIAGALFEDMVDRVFGDERGNGVAQRLRHSHGFDDPLT
jgi:hypothetical protein